MPCCAATLSNRLWSRGLESGFLQSCSETVPQGLYSTEAPGAAGVVASPAARWLDAEHDRAGRVKVRVDLSVPSHPDIFVLGDTPAVTDQPGIPVTAP